MADELRNPGGRFPRVVRYRSEMVDLWATEDIVDQIGVHGGYRGQLLGRIGIGSTVGDLEQLVGPVAEDDDDNFIVRGTVGLCFEVEGVFSGAGDPRLLMAPITWFFVYLPMPSTGI